MSVPADLAYDGAGLVPVVVQDRRSGDVLMMAWANAEALARTAETGLAHFWSRRRRALWRKGETSGHGLLVRELRADCDRDTLLMVVDPEGPACHTGTRTCFGDEATSVAGVLAEVGRVIEERDQSRPEGSYTARLLAKGQNEVLKKIGEEAVEVALAARSESDERLAEEAADLVFHLLVALGQRRVGFERVLEALKARRQGR
ncbi:MAG TPA: bifunctional phosphoribosyl-AMP cyclohydrolase/phosphoribosyl-ATP diphosphatase HisIE [Vicinamibacteria bacterium]|nr:bifunctional phosphoribosyl-AMP cyclohydrolase/phosphoribosyl-ATP diphosphatase HisIE [Vicinamibacteria bacterium]